MKTYANYGNDSGVESYEFGLDFIRVAFKGGGIYLYDHLHTGVENIKRMCQLAEQGRGLNSFINKYVRNKHAKRER
jgi:hypothetical protein